MEYKREFHRNYLILNGKVEDVEHYSMQMILQKNVPYVLPLKVQRLNEEVSYCYDITDLQSIKEFTEKNSLKKQLITNLLYSILKLIESSKKFLLDEDDFVFLPETIFWDSTNQIFYFCYCHNYRKSIKEQIVCVLEYFLDYVDYEDKEAVLMMYSLYKISRQECTYQKFEELLNAQQEDFDIDKNILPIKEEMQVMNEAERENLFSNEKTDIVEKSEDFGDFCMPEASECNKKYPIWVWVSCICSIVVCLTFLIIASVKGYLFDKETGELYFIRLVALFGLVGILETSILNWILQDKYKIQNSEYPINREKEELVCWDKEEETVVLAMKEQEDLYLVPVNSELYEEISINEFPFFVGKLREKVDARIQSCSVSRYHARIDKEGNEFYITDLKSTNGTYVNGLKLNPNQRKKIKIDDEISFADIKYKFFCK